MGSFGPFYGEQIDCGKLWPFLWEQINCEKLALFMVRFKYYMESVLEAGNVLKVGKCSEVCKFSGEGESVEASFEFLGRKMFLRLESVFELGKCSKGVTVF